MIGKSGGGDLGWVAASVFRLLLWSYCDRRGLTRGNRVRGRDRDMLARDVEDVRNALRIAK